MEVKIKHTKKKYTNKSTVKNLGLKMTKFRIKKYMYMYVLCSKQRGKNSISN